MTDSPLKVKTARSLKWNVVDRVSTQIIYAVTGIVLARELSQEAFGLVGAIMVFQAFALLFIDSGFSFALIQRKAPTETDYSSVFWLNTIIACVLYIILYLCAPLIADCFGGDLRLISLSRVMFLSFIVSATASVPTNRLVKQMNVKPIAIANCISLAAGGAVGILMAVYNYGPWAIVAQTIVINALKTILLMAMSRWVPRRVMSWRSLKSFFGVGSGMMATSFLNTLFLNIYSFFIGNRAGIVPLGYYSQADKWSKMGVTAISQILTSAFLPALSEVQDDRERFTRVALKMSRFTGYLLFPALGFLAVMATPVFHVLFGQKWDPSIILFQLLLFRGLFTVLNSLYNNFILALGRSHVIFWLEVFRDSVAMIGILVTLPYISLSTPANIVEGLTIFMSGQVIASFLTWIVTIIVTVRVTGLSPASLLASLLPYFAITVSIMIVLYGLTLIGLTDWLLLTLQAVSGLTLYLIANRLLSSKIQSEVFASIRR